MIVTCNTPYISNSKDLMVRMSIIFINKCRSRGFGVFVVEVRKNGKVANSKFGFMMEDSYFPNINGLTKVLKSFYKTFA